MSNKIRFMLYIIITLRYNCSIGSSDNMKCTKEVIIGSISILVIVAIIVLSCLAINSDFFNLDLKVNHKAEINEKELKDEKIKSDINVKFEYLNSYFKDSELDDIKTNPYRIYNDTGFRKEILNGEMSDKLKLYIVLNNLEDKFNQLSGDFYNANISDEVKNYADGDEDEIFKEIDVTQISNLYKELFNEDIKEFYSYEDECPTYLYDDVSNKYFRMQECGGSPIKGYHTYKSKYTYKDDEVYLYVYYGVINCNSESNKCVLYKDLEEKEIYKEVTDDGKSLFVDNYKEFTKYKYTFKKNSNGGYSLKNIEKSDK